MLFICVQGRTFFAHVCQENCSIIILFYCFKRIFPLTQTGLFFIYFFIFLSPFSLPGSKLKENGPPVCFSRLLISLFYVLTSFVCPKINKITHLLLLFCFQMEYSHQNMHGPCVNNGLRGNS